ncbi:M99 family carboxypeptidase catalytic domain-containing protein [Nitratidesulfovibrio vulgaris]|jgi:hypothetical protein|uniref:M99 family carboxypeptidase catalytic domain-containing protein n=1 Tax=Nitratidesulfovibrio vulgaris TaxID=881 RepID=UPI0023008C0E|nr:M99 family carboxypeptidase catalytic domain-containing protein [Nitratidesulfovibrio vulgaris]WCB46586.1 M99 family carboxypeptidase catalytic domain-containing protein [Nitratidesulfovibrio vulgaris]
MRWISALLPGLLVFASLWACSPALAAPEGTNLDFTLHRLGTGGPVVLVVGGIQGDEPGGFSAATLLVTHYRFTSGRVWVVPNLNFPSIIKRSRGVHGDLNRKFATLPADDPEYPLVQRIQRIITAPDVSLVLNLHDGSGFYRPDHEDAQCNPSRWGQSVIIDKARLEGAPLGDLTGMGERAVRDVNEGVLVPKHRYHLKNTRTDEGDHEMDRTLTWFAYRNGKPAFGIEASKDFTTEYRAYYHLRAVEAFLKQAGVRFERDFDLSPRGVQAALESDVTVGFAHNRIVLPLDDVRPSLGSFPLPRDVAGTFAASKPILALVSAKGGYDVFYGNRTLTRLRPDWRDTDDALSGMTLMVDGKPVRVGFGEVVSVRERFVVQPVKGYRINAIGATAHRTDESGIPLGKRDFMARYSVDKAGTLYRVEVYRGQKFAGMVLVRFGSGPTLRKAGFLPAVAGRESDLGM